MALDWKKNVSPSSVKGLFGKGGGVSAGSSYPSKTTMNLYVGDTKTADVRKVAVAGVALALLIGLFVKFGVLDQLAMLSQRQGELAEQQLLVDSMDASLDEYAAVKEVYDSYMVRYGGGSADAISLLDMVEQHVMNTARVTSLVLSDGTLTLTLYDIPLDTVGDLAKDLENQDVVTSVNVSTATTQKAEGQNTVSTLVITLAGSGNEEE